MAAEAGLSYSDFLLMDSEEFAEYYTGYQKRMNELTRMGRKIAAAVLLQFMKDGSTLNPMDLFSLPDEKEIDTRKTTENDVKRMARKWELIDKKRAEKNGINRIN